MANKKSYVGIELIRTDKLKPEYRIAHDISVVYFNTDPRFGMIATIKPYRGSYLFGNYTKAERLAWEKRKAYIAKRDAAYKVSHGGKDRPLNTSHWKRVDDYSRKAQIAKCILTEELLDSQAERNIYKGRRQALSWDIHQTSPNWWKSKIIGWANIGGVSDDSLQGVIDQMGGSQGNPLSLMLGFSKNPKKIASDKRKLKTMFGGIFNKGFDYQVYLKELKKYMIVKDMSVKARL